MIAFDDGKEIVEVEVCVSDVRGEKVRLGIIAPRKVIIHRKEIYEAIEREKFEARQAVLEAKAAQKENNKPR